MGKNKGGKGKAEQDHQQEVIQSFSVEQLQQLAAQMQTISMESLTPEVRAKVETLTSLNEQREALMKQFNKECMMLRLKYEEQVKPLYSQRLSVIDTANCGGIPKFWMTAIQNHPNLSDCIFDDDMEALSYITDVRCELDPTGETDSFKLYFDFAPNAFFENSQLTKEYVLDGEDELKSSSGCQIIWKAGKCLTEKSVKKVVKKRGKGKTTVFKTEKVDSFFHFFSPPQLPKQVS